MPTCFKFATTGYAAPNYLMDDAGTQRTSPVTIARMLVPDAGVTDIASCSFVSISGAEYLALKNVSGGTVQTPSYPAWNELGSLSIADAQVISGYVGLLWAGVWGLKQVIKSLSISERYQDE